MAMCPAWMIRPAGQRKRYSAIQLLYRLRGNDGISRVRFPGGRLDQGYLLDSHEGGNPGTRQEIEYIAGYVDPTGLVSP